MTHREQATSVVAAIQQLTGSVRLRFDRELRAKAEDIVFEALTDACANFAPTEDVASPFGRGRRLVNGATQKD